MAGPGVNHVNVPARFSMPPARPLEANASCRLDRRQPVLSNTFGLWGPVPRPAAALHLSRLSTTCHPGPPLRKPQAGPGAGPDQTRPGPRSARTRGGTSSATELAFVVSRVTNVPRGSPRGTSTRSPRGKLTRAVVRLENDSWYATAITHGVPIRSRPFADCLGLFPTGARRRSGRARSGPSGSANPSRAADIHR